jgi:hypothetical protein
MGMMDLMYQNAQITIVASAGEDPTHGLPGVSAGDRSTQACATIGKHFLVSTPSNPQESILSSKWKTRAWTYQEALFSRRRLFFTDKQVYYECEGMCCCEALNFPLLDLHRNNSKTFQKSFSERWSSDMGFFSGLCWNLKAASARRPGFPSWSWTGWYGHVSWGYEESEWSSLRIDRDVKLELIEPASLTDAHRAKLLEIYKDDTGGWAREILHSNLIKISAWVTPILLLGRIEGFERRDRHNTGQDTIEYGTKIALEDGGYMEWSFESNTNSLLPPGQQYWGIHLAHQDGSHDSMRKTGPTLMVVSGVGGVIERVRFSWVDQSRGKKYDKNGVYEFADEPDMLWWNPEFLEPIYPVKHWQTLVLK